MTHKMKTKSKTWQMYLNSSNTIEWKYNWIQSVIWHSTTKDFIESKCCWLRSKKRSQCQNQNENSVTSFVIAMLKERKTTFNLSKHYIFNWKKKSLYLPSMTRSCCILFVSLWNRGSTSNVTERRRSREKESLFLESTSFISLCAKINSFVKMSWNRKLIETLRRTWWETFYHAEVYMLSILVSSIISI